MVSLSATPLALAFYVISNEYLHYLSDTCSKNMWNGSANGREFWI
jgi:hypothetical protein